MPRKAKRGAPLKIAFIRTFLPGFSPFVRKATTHAYNRFFLTMNSQCARRAFLICLLASLSIPVLLGQGLSPQLAERVDQVISTEMARRNIPGVSVAIAVGDSPIWSRGYGLADLENFVPATERSRYRLASISKPITAVALLKLVEAGKANLDDDVRRYVPEFPQKSSTVTLRQLLGHLGGIRSYRGEESESTRHYVNVRDGLEMFSADPLEHQPGSKYLYSTYGFNLAGAAAESIAGVPFRELIATTVFQPAGMLQTRDDSTYDLIPNRVAGYRRASDGSIQNCVLADTSNKVPGGGLIATAPDVVRFGRAILDGAIATPSMRKLMFTPQRLNDGKPSSYGMGWNITTLEGRQRVFHGGGQAGTSTFLDVLPEDGIVVAVLANLQGADPKTISEEILNVLLGRTATEE